MTDTTQGTALVAHDGGQQPKPAKAQLMAGIKPLALVPVDFEGAYRIANVVVEAGMAPKTLQSKEKAMVAILHGLEVGLTPMAALQSIAVINGRPTIWGDGAIALIRASGLLEWMQEKYEGEGEKLVAVCIVKRKGEPQPVRGEFSWADAKKANLLGKEGPWQTYPRRMLQMRARWPLRDVFADVLKGLALREEMEDMERANAPEPAPVLKAPPPPDEEPITKAAEPTATHTDVTEGQESVAEVVQETTIAADDGFPGDAPSGFPGDTPLPKAPAPDADPDDLGIPYLLDVEVKRPEKEWLRSLDEAFGECADTESLMSEQESVMMPAREAVGERAWQHAVQITRKHLARIQG